MQSFALNLNTFMQLFLTEWLQKNVILQINL